jgi:hypothetical protein
MSGEDLDLLPRDDAKLLEEAKPIAPDGRFRQDRAKLSARHDGEVQAALKRASSPWSSSVERTI